MSDQLHNQCLECGANGRRSLSGERWECPECGTTWTLDGILIDEDDDEYWDDDYDYEEEDDYYDWDDENGDPDDDVFPDDDVIDVGEGD